MWDSCVSKGLLQHFSSLYPLSFSTMAFKSYILHLPHLFFSCTSASFLFQPQWDSDCPSHHFSYPSPALTLDDFNLLIFLWSVHFSCWGPSSQAVIISCLGSGLVACIVCTFTGSFSRSHLVPGLYRSIFLCNPSLLLRSYFHVVTLNAVNTDWSSLLEQ